jgi:hypothetical protein
VASWLALSIAALGVMCGMNRLATIDTITVAHYGLVAMASLPMSPRKIDAGRSVTTCGRRYPEYLGAFSSTRYAMHWSLCHKRENVTCVSGDGG